MLLRQFFARLRSARNWSGKESEFDEELQFHLAEEAEERVAAGLDVEEARFAASRDFGNVGLIREAIREVWVLGSLERLIQDVRHGLRTMRRDPGFTLIAVLTLGLGIGATTAVFAVLDAVVLRPLPVPEPERLVMVVPQLDNKRWILVNPLFEGLLDQQRSLEGIFAVSDKPYLKVQFDDAPAPEFLRGSSVSGAYFRTLGLAPAAGRFLTEEDDRIPGTGGNAGCAAVVGHPFWSRRLQRDPGWLGRTVRVGHIDCTIVGIAPPGFRSHQPGYVVDLWVPMRQVTAPQDLANHYGAFFSGVMGRLKKGVSASQAEAELTTLYQQLQAAEPPPPPDIPDKPIAPGDVSIRLARGAHGLDALQREFESPLQIIQLLVTFVLLIAGANVAGLFIMHAASRGPEFLTRAALGAGRGRLVRQLVTESSLVVALGGVVGFALAWWGGPVLASFVSLPWMPIAVDVRPDVRLLALTFSATASAALLAGLVPAWRLSRSTIASGLASAGRVAGTGLRQRAASSLVALQLALSLLLVTATGLLLTTMRRLSGVDPGFHPEHVVALEISHEDAAQPSGVVDRAAENARLLALYSRVESQLDTLAGVRHASLSWLGLFGGSDQRLRLVDPAHADDKRLARVDRVSARYFDTVGMSVTRGRGFTDADREGAPRVAVVNEALVTERFGAAEAIGRQMTLDYPGERDRPVLIVGIVRNSKYNDLREENTASMIWVPLAQAPLRIRSVMLRVQPGTAGAVARQAQVALSSVDPNLMVRRTTTLASIVDETTERERLMLGLSAAFGVLGLLLAAIGLYGALAFAVVRRTKEIGLRLALGADRARVLRWIIGDALRLSLVAIVLGVPAALGAGYALRAFLFGVEPYDVPTLASACVVLAMTALAAAYIPARRAASVDPMTALRCE